jgi:hypothetical protein
MNKALTFRMGQPHTQRYLKRLLAKVLMETSILRSSSRIGQHSKVRVSKKRSATKRTARLLCGPDRIEPG